MSYYLNIFIYMCMQYVEVVLECKCWLQKALEELVSFLTGRDMCSFNRHFCA